MPKGKRKGRSGKLFAFKNLYKYCIAFIFPDIPTYVKLTKDLKYIYWHMDGLNSTKLARNRASLITYLQ